MTIARPSERATTECAVCGGTTATMPGPATWVSSPMVTSNSPSSTCQTSSCSWLWAWMSAPALNSQWAKVSVGEWK